MTSSPVTASVIVPAYRADATLPACLDSLLAQRTDATFEVIVVVSADRADELPDLAPHPRLRVLTAAPRLPAAAARNRGVRVARGDALVFTDADVVVPPGWLNALLEASAEDWCVAGSVRNGTPRSAVGTAEYLVEFIDLHPRRPARTAWHGATCNLLVPRSLWQRYGPFPEDMDGGEDTLLTVRLRADGHFRFAPDVAVIHHNRTRLGVVLAHQVAFGRFNARLARRSPLRMGFLVRYSPLAPVAAIGRVLSLYVRVAAWTPRSLPQAIAAGPVVVLALAAWGTGLALEGLALDARRLRVLARRSRRRAR